MPLEDFELSRESLIAQLAAMDQDSPSGHPTLATVRDVIQAIRNKTPEGEEMLGLYVRAMETLESASSKKDFTGDQTFDSFTL